MATAASPPHHALAASPTALSVRQLVARFDTPSPTPDDGSPSASPRELSYASPATSARRASALANFGAHRFTQPTEALSDSLRGTAAAARASSSGGAGGLAVTAEDCELARWPEPMSVVCSESSNAYALRWVQSGQSGCVTLACSLETLWVLGAGLTIYCCPLDTVCASSPEPGKVRPPAAAAIAAADADASAIMLVLLPLRPVLHADMRGLSHQQLDRR